MAKNINEKLVTVKSTQDTESHLVPTVKDCRRCEDKPCLYVCPAEVYEWVDSEQSLLVKYENCLECGACKIVCKKHSLGWKYPKSSYGITYKHG